MKKQIISFTLLAAGFLIGATALSAMADWSPAPGTPPNNNVPAPINVGNGIPRLNTAGVQEKTDSFNIDGNLGVLGLGAFNNLAVTGNLNVYAGASTTANTVLANDGSGNA
ncbi:MAG: hypothetical protein KGI49_03265, partial [Patescibacteria group bacterium]|nr:hypothetical protein [Patescibacteria group bacterium]